MITVSFVILDCSSRFSLADGSPPAPPAATIAVPTRLRPSALPRSRLGSFSAAGAESESGQALRAVVRNARAGDLVERTIPLDGVAHQFRGVPVNLVEIGTVWRQPDVVRAAADDSADPPEGAISRNLRAR